MAWKRIEIGASWAFARTSSTGVEWTRPVMALAASNWTLSRLLIVVADGQGAQATADIPARYTIQRCRPMTVQYVSSPGCASQSPEVIDAVGHGLVELSYERGHSLLSKSALSGRNFPHLLCSSQFGGRGQSTPIARILGSSLIASCC